MKELLKKNTAGLVSLLSLGFLLTAFISGYRDGVNSVINES